MTPKMNFHSTEKFLFTLVFIPGEMKWNFVSRVAILGRPNKKFNQTRAGYKGRHVRGNYSGINWRSFTLNQRNSYSNKSSKFWNIWQITCIYSNEFEGFGIFELGSQVKMPRWCHFLSQQIENLNENNISELATRDFYLDFNSQVFISFSNSRFLSCVKLTS